MWIKEKNSLLERLLYQDWIEQHLNMSDFVDIDRSHRCCDVVEWIDHHTRSPWAYRRTRGNIVSVYLEDPKEAVMMKLKWG